MIDHDAEPEPPALPPEARSLLSSYRDDEAMPRDARRRVWNAVAAAPAARRSEAAVAGRWGKWVGGGLAAAAAILLVAHFLGAAGTAERIEDPALQAAPDRAVTPGTGAEASSRRTASSERERSGPAADPQPRPHVPTPEALPAPTRTAPASDAPSHDPGPHHAPPRRDRAPKAATRPEAADASPSGSAGDLAAERELIAAAWRALAKGSASQARAHAETHARRFPHGMLAPEREAVHAIAGCREASSPRPDLADAFERAHPRSPLGARVREACEPSTP